MADFDATEDRWDKQSARSAAAAIMRRLSSGDSLVSGLLSPGAVRPETDRPDGGGRGSFRITRNLRAGCRGLVV